MLSGPNLPGAPLYAGAVLDLQGSVNGMAFTDPLGYALVGNDRFVPQGGADFFSVAAATLGTGFEISGYVLDDVRIFLIENDTTQEDFLNSDLLPNSVPIQRARLALDFVLQSDPNVTTSVFYNDAFIIADAPAMP